MPGGYCYLLHPEQVVKGASSGRVEATSRSRALGTEPSPPLAPSQGIRAGDDGHWRRRSDGTRPGAQDVAFPSSRSQSGIRAGDADRQRLEATAQGRALGSFPLLSLPVRDASRRPQRPQRRLRDGRRPGAWDVAFPFSLSQSGMRAGDADDGTQGYEQDEQLRSVLGRADPEQGPP